MTIQNRIDRASRVSLEELLKALPGGFNAIADIKERRNTVDSLLRMMIAELPPIENVVMEDRNIPGPDGSPEVGVRIYKPVDVSASLPGMFFIHGGGMIMGSIEGENLKAAMLCETIQAVVVSVEYRLAPENPHPAPVQDCYEALVWMSKSAGGGLAIATALMARDQEFPKLCFQMANYPMIDDRNETPSSKEITDVGIWDREANLEAWDWYLGGKPADEYAAPARAKNLSDLPPTFIDVGEIDLFRDEDIEFATRLLQAGVTTELHVYPGAYHASEAFAPDAELSKQIWAKRIEALKRALKT
jgi:acetyl esterase/lipase